MKYLTKEWIGDYERILFANNVKLNGNMEVLTESAYKRMYKKYKTDFIKYCHQGKMAYFIINN